jgi:hypothetical protein
MPPPPIRPAERPRLASRSESSAQCRRSRRSVRRSTRPAIRRTRTDPHRPFDAGDSDTPATPAPVARAGSSDGRLPVGCCRPRRAPSTTCDVSRQLTGMCARVRAREWEGGRGRGSDGGEWLTSLPTDADPPPRHVRRRRGVPGGRQVRRSTGISYHGCYCDARWSMFQHVPTPSGGGDPRGTCPRGMLGQASSWGVDADARRGARMGPGCAAGDARRAALRGQCLPWVCGDGARGAPGATPPDAGCRAWRRRTPWLDGISDCRGCLQPLCRRTWYRRLGCWPASSHGQLQPLLPPDR